MVFDPVKIRRISEEETLPRLRSTEFDEKRPMGNVAMLQLGQVIRLWLVGLSDDTRDILAKLHVWIENAIEKKEDFGESYNLHHMNLHQAAAICHWMISGNEAHEHWNQARILNGAISLNGNDYDGKSFSTLRLDEYMAYAYLCGKYESGIAEFEKYYQLKNINLGVLKPRECGYAACMYKSRSTFARVELFKYGKKFLKRYMHEQWLGTGQFLRAVMWLKVVYEFEDTEVLSPLQTVLKAYENVSDILMPDFIK